MHFDSVSPLSTNGANHTSLGQRPGFARKKNKALKGRAIMVPPLQGFDPYGTDDPGRCPGLACGRAFGPQHLTRSKRIAPFVCPPHLCAETSVPSMTSFVVFTSSSGPSSYTFV